MNICNVKINSNIFFEGELFSLTIQMPWTPYFEWFGARDLQGHPYSVTSQKWPKLYLKNRWPYGFGIAIIDSGARDNPGDKIS